MRELAAALGRDAEGTRAALRRLFPAGLRFSDGGGMWRIEGVAEIGALACGGDGRYAVSFHPGPR